jgi:hypothetical protein
VAITHWPDVETDAAAAVVALPAILAALTPTRAFPSTFVPVLNSTVFPGKERPLEGVDGPVVFCQHYPGEPVSLADDDAESYLRIRFTVRGGSRSYGDAEAVARLIMAGLHLRRDVAATQTTTGKPAVYADVRILDAGPQPFGENREERDRFGVTAVFLYAD